MKCQQSVSRWGEWDHSRLARAEQRADARPARGGPDSASPTEPPALWAGLQSGSNHSLMIFIFF